MSDSADGGADAGAGSFDLEELIASTAEERVATRSRRSSIALGLSATFTICWAIYVTASGQWGRVIDQWASAVTMIFGSFVAGSTPQGGGAVAFPVFTKVLEVPADVARTFSLSIQSVGMTAASLSILINRRRIVPAGVGIAGPAAIAGFLAGYFLIIKTDLPFGPSTVPGSYVKVMFTVVIAGMAFVTYLGYRVQLLEKRDAMPPLNGRLIGMLIFMGLAGGFTSVLVGSGADMFVYLALVVLVGLSPRTGVASSVLVMTAVSIVGFILFGIVDGHLSVLLDSSGEVVNQVSDKAVGIVDGSVAFGATGGLEAGRFDLFGLWLAAAPIVCWGAPLGSAVSSRVTDRQLVRFVVALALAETISTIIFLDDLRTDAGLAVFAIVSTVVFLSGLWLLNKHRNRILGLPAVDPSRSVTRGDVDLGPRLDEQLRQE
ncbi:MAG: sulfite exporter TauE/SafE family protein [Actinomycetota bacterium]